MALDITTARLDVAKLYIAAFDRAPDVSGLNFWVNAYVSGKDTLNSIAQKFTNSDEYKAKYPSYLSNAEIVEKVYVNVFDRASDATGKAFWVNALTTGALTTGTLMKAMVDAATANGGTDNANLTAQAQAGVDAAVVAANTSTLTSGNDNLTGMLFEAPQTYTPGGTDKINSLQDNDKLTGTSAADVLNVTIGQDSDLGDTNIMPILTGVDTINVSFDRTAYNLDMQDSKGTTTEVNVKRMEAGATNAVNNMADLAAKYSVTSSETAAASLTFDLLDSAVSGTSDATILALNKANVDSLVLQASASNGVETINMQSNVSSNVIGQLTAEDLKTLNISGSQALRIGATSNITNGALIEGTRYTAGLANVAGSLTAVDASTMTGALTLVMGAELNAGLESSTGTLVSMAVTGGTAADKFVLAQGASIDAVTGNTDVISGGEGTDTLVLLGGAAQAVAAATTANLKSIEALEIRAGHDSVANNVAEVADLVTVDADAFDSLATIYIRNEGSGDIDPTLAPAAEVIGSKVEAMTVTLNDLTATQAAAITVAHGTTANNGLLQNILNVALKTATGATDTVGVTLVDGFNTDGRFNLNLSTNAVENITITDSDTESNTVQLTSVASHIGTLTVTGGAAGQFMNFDTTTAGANGGIYGYVTTGAAAGDANFVADHSLTAGQVKVAATTVNASGAASNVVVRLTDPAAAQSATGAQTVTMGTGNDTVIFDTVNNLTSGLTITDVVAGGTGTDILAIDGNNAAGIALGASEFTSVTGFETIHFVGNAARADDNSRTGTNSYKLTLSDAAITANAANGSVWSIVNDNSETNYTVTRAGGNVSTAITANSGITIDARALSTGKSFNYNGQETNTGKAITVNATTAVSTAAAYADANSTQNTTTMSADRFIFADAGLNATAIIDGGAEVDTGARIGHVANADVLEVRNAAVVSFGDLANISNVGTIEFTNDTAVDQTSTLQLTNAVVEAMVNNTLTTVSTNATTIGNSFEQLTITAVNGAAAKTAINMDASLVTNAALRLVITGGDVVDTIIAGAGDDTITGGAGDDTITGGAGADTMTGGLGADTYNYSSLAIASTLTGITLATADTITDFAAADFIKIGTAGTAANYVEAAATEANFATAQASADTAMNGTVVYYFSDTAANGGLLFMDSNLDGTADAVIVMTGQAVGTFALTNIIA